MAKYDVSKLYGGPYYPNEKSTQFETKLDKRPSICWVPTPLPLVKKIVRTIAPNKNDVFFDLGCGDGRLCVEMAKTYGIHCVGVDAVKEKVDTTTYNAKLQKVERLVETRYQNIFDVDLSDATIVYMYLYYNMVDKLVPILNKKKNIKIYTRHYHPNYIKDGEYHSYAHKEYVLKWKEQYSFRGKKHTYERMDSILEHITPLEKTNEPMNHRCR